ncbi:hypothetical protein AD998_20500 [bacterium 336/3]|nr:hypothetical protein AD998_20500 [bacterium 336/3]
MKIYIIFINIIFILCFLPSLGAAVMSPMIMASATRDRREMPIGMLAMIMVALFPVVIAIAQYCSWKYYSANNLKFSLYYACAPLMWVALLFLLLPLAWVIGRLFF